MHQPSLGEKELAQTVVQEKAVPAGVYRRDSTAKGLKL